ncbi:chorismate-binding protein [Arcanobacterium hippocoleae]
MMIRQGKLEKVVLSRSLNLNFPHPISLPKLTQTLAAGYPNTWVFSVDGLVGASPEMLAQTENSQHGIPRVHCRVLAGTKPLQIFAENDFTAEFELETSQKDIREHRVAVNSAAAALQEFGTVEIGEPYVLTLPNVEHFATDIYTTLDGTLSLLAVIGKLHPTAALGGNPREKANEVITQLEGDVRERYGAPVGWISHGAAGEFGQWAIALRCCQVSADLRSATAWAGGGIMADSIPENELAETQAKFSPAITALKSQFAN